MASGKRERSNYSPKGNRTYSSEHCSGFAPDSLLLRTLRKNIRIPFAGAKLQKGDINIADVFLNELSRNPAYFNMDAVKTLIPNEEQRMRILRVLEDHMVIEIKGGGIWLKAAANLSVCKDQGGCAVIYNEQRKQEERDNLELRNLKISRREAHWAIALAIISICASQFWGHTIFEWTWIAMQKISKLLF